MKAFQLKSSTGIGRKVKLPNYMKKIRSLEVDNDFPIIQPVQGIMPDSKEEYWVALALNKMRLQYEFQRSVMGGRNVPGGSIVDFWVYTPPLPTIVMVQGDYWHYVAPRTYETILKIARLKAYYAGQIYDVVELLTSKMPTPDEAYQLVRSELKS